VESDKFHTSCSAPLETGDLFGNLLLVAFDGVGSGATVTYQYEVTNFGDPVFEILVTDNQLGDIGTIPALPTADGNSAILRAVTELSETTTNTATAEGTLSNGEVCDAQDSVTVTAVEPTCQVSIRLDKIDDRKIKWKLSNPSEVGATIDTLIVSWPGDGELKKVKYNGKEILKDVLLSSPATITSDEWLKQPKDRTVKAGDSGKRLEIEFDANFPLKKTQPPEDFDLKISFEQGCSVTF
jgi:hypothetical protein